jgi:hypothetical protein
MKRMTATAIVLALFVALTFSATAQQPDTRDRTIMTFGSAVEMPGMRLEPGTYVFRLADTASRNVIQVLDQDEKDVKGQWLFVPAERQEVTDDTVVTFRETSAASTPAVQYWFYPGEKIGKEFVYPKDQAARIAQRTGATVQTEEGPVGVDAQGSGAVEGSGLPDSQAETAVAAPDRSQQSETVGTAGAQTPAATDASAREPELPATASPLALTGLLGFLSLAGAAGIRSFRSM